MKTNLFKKGLIAVFRNLSKCHNSLSIYFSGYLIRFRGLYYKSILAECGEGLIVDGNIRIWNPENIYVGNKFTINDGCQISARGKVYIGNNVVMSRGSQITVGQLDTSKWIEEEGKVRTHIQPSVYIADGCWLCINSIVLPGVKITGKGVIVAAGAVVSQDITEDYVVVGGIPAKVIKKLTK
jgi:acetyltransferase-like isoleucine patch superfamily enzyme